MTIQPDLHTAQWRKSSYSGGNNGTCVEVADGFPARARLEEPRPRPGGADEGLGGVP
jgi:hypothetical protein